MGTCAKCGKNVSFFESHNYWNNQLRRHGYIDFNKKFVNKSENCVEVPELKGKQLCLDCAIGIYFGKRFKDASDENRSQVIVQDTVQTADGISKHIESISKVGLSYGYLFKQETHVLTNYFGASLITLTMFFEKTQQVSTVQILVDFSSLKDVMAKGGLVMTTYKCPNCNAMVNIPESGKVLMCQYCGTPIKPVDIFEKIKSLIH
jgi:hypothetical protein